MLAAGTTLSGSERQATDAATLGRMEGSLFLAAFVALLIGWMWVRRRASTDAEAHLRRICFGDQQQVDRLVDGELRRAGKRISRAEAARRALDRHRRDNR